MDIVVTGKLGVGSIADGVEGLGVLSVSTEHECFCEGGGGGINKSKIRSNTYFQGLAIRGQLDT